MRPLFIIYSFIVAFPEIILAETFNPADFHRDVYTLQKQQLAQREIREEVEEGNYEGAAAAGYRYVDIRYYDAASGNLLSRIRHVAAKPELIHIIEVNIYVNNKLVRDFGSISPPWSPLYPTNAYINIHQYNGELHSFRQYNISGQIDYEFCKGKFSGKPVHISLDGSDINVMNTSSIAYKNCFEGINKDWAQYRTPH